LITVFYPFCRRCVMKIIDSIIVMRSNLKSFTISARVMIPVFGIKLEVIILFTIATNKAPAPSPKRGSAIVGLMNKATKAAATAMNNPTNILILLSFVFGAYLILFFVRECLAVYVHCFQSVG